MFREVSNVAEAHNADLIVMGSHSARGLTEIFVGSNTEKVVLSREDYANVVGTATETAIRILSQFKREGLIFTRGKQIKIENEDGLKRIE